MVNIISSQQTFRGNSTAKSHSLVDSLRSKIVSESRKISLTDVAKSQPVEEDVFAKNSISHSVQGGITYLRNVDSVIVENKEVEGTVDMAAGILKNSKAKSINAYGSAKVVESCSKEGTYVGGEASLQGGRHGYLNIQDNAQVTSVSASAAVLYGKSKLSNSTTQHYIEANDFTTLENVKAPQIIMNGWFTRLKGKNNQCDKLQADCVWRVLHMDFRKSIKPE